MLRVIQAACGRFALIPISCNFPVIARDLLLEQLGHDLRKHGAQLLIAQLSSERWNPIEAMTLASRSSSGRAVIALVGLEETPGIIPEPGVPAARPPAIALLNNTRETIRKQFAFPLLIWCEPSVSQLLQNEAPDLYDHFVAIFEFHYRGPDLTPKSLDGGAEPPLGISSDLNANIPPASGTALSFYEERIARFRGPSEERARALLGFAEATLGMHLERSDQGDLSRALSAIEEALTLLSEQQAPVEVAQARFLLGLVYSNLPTGDRGDNLKRAIACYEAALRVYTERGFPQDWAMTQNNLGLAYADLPTGDRGDNLKRAIACYEAALRGYELAGASEEARNTREILLTLKTKEPDNKLAR